MMMRMGGSRLGRRWAAKVLAGAGFAIAVWGRAAEPRPLVVEDLFRMQRLADPQISPDGQWVAYSVSVVDKAENKSRSRIWLVPAAGGPESALPVAPPAEAGKLKHEQHARWSPDGKWLAFESDRSGTPQIYVQPAAGGEARAVTKLGTGAERPVWSPDGGRLGFVSKVRPQFSTLPPGESDAANAKHDAADGQSKVKARVFTKLLYRHWNEWVDGKRLHVFVVPVKDGAATGEAQDWTPGDRDGVPAADTFSAGDEFAFSPDGKELAYTAPPTPAREEAWRTDHDIYTVNLETGDRRQVTTNPAADGLPHYSPDGKYLAYRAQARPGFEADRWQLMLRDRATGMTRSLTADFDASVESFAWGPKSDQIYLVAEEKGNRLIWSVAVTGGPVAKVLDAGANGDVTVAPGGDWLAVTHQSMTRPVEIARVNLAATPGQPTVLTHANDAVFAELLTRPPESVWFTGAAGAKVQMWIVKPPHFDAGKQYPLVFWVHGGPQSAFVNAWSYRWNAQLWAAQGYVVALPNPRGSPGFGQKFVDEISRDWGGKVFEDLMAGLAYMEAQPYVDRKRMAAAGASYGGYMMNWFQGHTDKFKTLITHDGVFSFWGMYGSTEELWFEEWEHGIPWQDADFEKFSPHRFAANFKTPNLIIHGEQDFRVPVSEGLSLFTLLQRKGVPSKLLYFPDEGHWVLKPQNSELWHRTIFEWLDDYLKK